MKPKEMREMSDVQLDDTMRDIQKKMFTLRFQAATEKQSAPSELKKFRKDVARILTIKRERELKKS